MPRVWIFLLFWLSLFGLPACCLTFQWSNHAALSEEIRNLARIKILRRQLGGEAVEKLKCPDRCEEKVREVFAGGYIDVPESAKVDPTTSPNSIVPDFWCYDKTYLGSLYVCLQQHCTQENSGRGWEDAGKGCKNKIPTPEEIKQDMQLKVIEIPDIELAAGTKVEWKWTTMLLGLTHNEVAHKQAENLNMILAWCLYGIAGAVLALATIYHAVSSYRARNIDFKASTHLEALSTISRKTRGTIILSKGTKLWTWIRKHFILPALFGRRHLEPIGWVTLPTRIQVLAVLLFICVNTIFLVIDKANAGFDRASQPGNMTRYIANRAGFLSLANLPIIFLLGGRNNFLIAITGLSYGVYNVFHKWVARVATVLAIIHSISYAVYMYQVGGAQLVDKQKNNYYWTNGIAATTVMSIITLLAILPFRRKFYELFLVLHIVGGILFLYFLFQHLKLSPTRSYNPWLWACIGCWAFDRLARFWRIILCNTRKGSIVKHNAKIKIIKETNIMKISIYPNKDGVGFFPGAHYFLYFGASWKFWQSHPFTAVDWRPKKALVNVNRLARHVKQQERERRLNTATSMNDPARLGTAGSNGNGDRLGTAGSNGLVEDTYGLGVIRLGPFASPDVDEWDNRAVVDDDGNAGEDAEWACGRAKITFLVRPHRGITQTIWNRIVARSGKDLGYDTAGNRIINKADVKGLNLSIPCLIEGPYGHQLSLHTYDTVVVIAGGIGVSTTLAYLYNHMSRVEKGETFTRRFVFVWSCREDMLMDRLIWDADLMNKTQDTSDLFGTQIEMMLYFTGTATKKQEVKFVEPWVKEMGMELDEKRNKGEGVCRRPSTGRGRLSSTGKKDLILGDSPVVLPPPVYSSAPSPKKDSSPIRRTTSAHIPAKPKQHPGDSRRKPEHAKSQSEKVDGVGASGPKRISSKRAKPEEDAQTYTPAPKRPTSRRSPPEPTEKTDAAPYKGVSTKSREVRNAEKSHPLETLQFSLVGEQDTRHTHSKPTRQDSTRSNREKRRAERDHLRYRDLGTGSVPPPPEPSPPARPIRRPSTRSNHEKRKERDDRDDRDRERTYSTRPPLPLKIGRPNLMEIIENENRMLTGKMAVLVCGPDKMVDGTREAVVKCVGKDAAEGARIQYFEEAFGW